MKEKEITNENEREKEIERKGEKENCGCQKGFGR